MSADIKFVVETPLAHRFPDARNFREAVRLAQLTKDRLVFINRVGEGIFSPLTSSRNAAWFFRCSTLAEGRRENPASQMDSSLTIGSSINWVG
jgi:hypothetical protein